MGVIPPPCVVCGITPRAKARFCDGCGTVLRPESPAAEYKQVTVLFADVTRSMQIATAVGPERLREIMAALFDRASTVITRYGGTLDKFIGDGVMALFGAPVAVEDHAVRACLAALHLQSEIRQLAAELAAVDGIDLQIRVGLNSGEVIGGEIGSGAMGYTVIGEQVGMGQRMESAAAPGGVMLSESTARLVAHATRLGELEMVHIKNAADPVPARRLLAVVEPRGGQRREAALIGRQSEMGLVADLLDGAVRGDGQVVGVVGPPGIGKSRITREVAALAAARGVEVFWTFCQSHSATIPFHVAAKLLRAFFGVSGLSPEAARATTRAALPGQDPQDLELLDDLLGIGAVQVSATAIDPDARRRRLTRLLEAALLSRREPAVYVIDDAHWIDVVSESLLADFIAAVPQTHALVLVAYRPEYTGALCDAAGSALLSLAPLDDSQSNALTTALLGSDPSVARLAERITERAAGNPFFTEEIVRDLVGRGVLHGGRGAYTCDSEAAVTVPATVQATIAARIDRLGAAAKRTLHTAAVIGSPFAETLLRAVLDDLVLTELVDADLLVSVDAGQYAFRHPLMRAVAYESQLKSARAQLHRSIASAIEASATEPLDASAALIATHLEAAGELAAAFGWHMRAGTFSTHRDITAARVSWQRAAAVADRLSGDDPDRLGMQIAARTLLCATIWRVGGELSEIGIVELRELATRADDKRSLVIAMSGVVQMLNFHGEYSEASRVASEQSDLLDAIGDPELTVGLTLVPSMSKWNAGEMTEAMRLADRAIELSGGDATMGNVIMGSPLAMAIALRASTRCCLGLPGWREDFTEALSMARAVDKFTYCIVVMLKYITAMNWALLPDDDAEHDCAEALEIAQQFGDDFLLTNAEFGYGSVLLRRADADRELGFELLARARRMALDHRYTFIAVLCEQLDLAAEAVRVGDFSSAITECRDVLQTQLRIGEGINRGWATTVLVEALLGRRADGDVQAAQEAVDTLAALPAEPVFLYHELPLLRLRALLAQAGGDAAGYREYRDRYRARAAEAGFDGHVAIGRVMA